MKEKVIEYHKSLGFETVSHDSSQRQIFHNDNIIVTVENVNKLKKGCRIV